jgi:hypothetical protein
MRPNPSLKRSANGRPPGPIWHYRPFFNKNGDFKQQSVI